jgi:hypothetical protein
MVSIPSKSGPYMEVWFPSWPWMQGQKSDFLFLSMGIYFR